MTTFVTNRALYIAAAVSLGVLAVLLITLLAISGHTDNSCSAVEKEIQQLSAEIQTLQQMTSSTNQTNRGSEENNHVTENADCSMMTSPLDRAKCVLDSFPLIDGHNDLADRYRMFGKDAVYKLDLASDIRGTWNKSLAQTDIPRLRAGKIGAQFWACYVSCQGQYNDAVRMSLDQMDVIKKFINKYPDTFQYVDKADDILESFRAGKIASMIGLEGGHSLDSSLGSLRMFYDLGVRYMTLTHSCNTPWADNWHMDQPSHANDSKHNGLTNFGITVVKEMNRLGMMVDLSHVAKKTMIDAINESKAPVIFSHSSAFSVCNHYRNVQDDVLQMAKQNGGIVMVNSYPYFVSCPPNNDKPASLDLIVTHIEHIKNTIGVDHVGIGADFDGIEEVSDGFEDVSKYPDLFAKLISKGWGDEDLRKLAGKNLIRVFKQVEKVRDELSYQHPFEDLLPVAEYVNDTCRTDF